MQFKIEQRHFAIAIVTHPVNKQKMLSIERNPIMVHLTMCSLVSNASSSDDGCNSGNNDNDCDVNNNTTLCDRGAEIENNDNTVPVDELHNDAITIVKLMPPRLSLASSSTNENKLNVDGHHSDCSLSLSTSASF